MRRAANVIALALFALCLAPATLGAENARVVWIAAGSFTMGATLEDLEHARRLCVTERMPSALRLRGCASDELFSNETPARRVHLSAYGIDRYEVTRAAYDACVRQGPCSRPEREIQHPGLTSPDHPVSGVTFAQAAAFCRARGGRLPSEAEWERAARADSTRRYPWGWFYNEGLANHGGPALTLDPSEGETSAQDGYTHLAPVGAFERSAGPHGTVQMAGNVWEWTADAYGPLSAQEQRVDPVVATGTGMRVVRGGSFRAPAFALRVTHREPRPEAGAFVDVGFRCAYHPP